MALRQLSANWGVILCFPGRGEWCPHYPCVFMCGQTKISPNRSIFKPEYSGISCVFLKCNYDDKIDTFFDKLEDCDSQGMGEWRTKGWESYQTDNQPTDTVLIIPRDFQFGFDTKNNWNLFIFSILCWRTAIRNSSESAVYLYLLVVLSY